MDIQTKNEKRKTKNTTDNVSDIGQKSGNATSMAELMSKANKTFTKLQKGAEIQGIITKLTSKEILVDIDAKSEAVVLEKDKRLLRNLLSNLKVGDTVTVQILNPESDQGNPVVSLRRFMDDAVWVKLEKLQKDQTPVIVTVNEITRGGYLVSTDSGISGFLPNSHTSFVTPATDGMNQNPQDLQGKKLDVFILELNRQAHKIIFSQKQIMKDVDFQNAVREFSIGNKLSPVISNVTNFGLFVVLHNKDGMQIDGLIHISEISWDDVADLQALYKSGATVDVVIIGIDKDSKRVDLSIKRLTKDPFEELIYGITLEQKVTGIVANITSHAVFLDIPSPSKKDAMVTGIIRKDKIPPNISFEVGESVTATVSQIETKRHRLILVPVLQAKPIGYR